MNDASNAFSYDIDSIVKRMRYKLGVTVFHIAVYFLLLAFSVATIVMSGDHIGMFISGIIATSAMVVVISIRIGKIKFSDYIYSRGVISAVYKDVKIVDTMPVGGVGLGTRRYDHYKINEVRLSVLIDDGDATRDYHLAHANEDHADYYEKKGTALHIWGTHFPVRLDFGEARWLCPVCGEFNDSVVLVCTRCKTKAVKQKFESEKITN